MNKIIFILLASISAFPISSIAQEQPPVQQQPPMEQQPTNGNGMLRVRLDDGSFISVSLDDKYFRNVGPVATIGNLPDGQHYLRIYVHRNGWGDNRGGRQLIFEGNVNVYQGQMTVFALNPFTGNTRNNTRDIRPNAYNRPDYEDYAYGAPENDGRGYQNQVQGNGYDEQGNQPNNDNPPGNNNAAPDSYNDNRANTPPPPPQDSYSNNNNNYQDNGGNNQDYSNNDNNNTGNNNQGGNYNGNGGYRYGGDYNDGNSKVPQTISQTYQPTSVDQPFMTRLRVKVGGKLTDTDKLKVLENGLAKQTVSTAQVNDMMAWLNFEASRVDFAKWAYDITVDKQNYPQLEGQFSYRSSGSELDDYINSKR